MTVIFTQLMKRVPPRKNGGNKTLILMERQELLHQTSEYISRHSDGLRVSIEQAGRPADLTADIIVASLQTLGRPSSSRLSEYDPEDSKCIVADKAHHAVAEAYTHIFEHFGVDNKETEIFLVEFSATLGRHDGVKLSGVFDHIPYHRPLKYMIDNAWLCPARNEAVVRDYKQYCARAVALTKTFRRRGCRAAVGTEQTSDIDHSQFLNAFKERRLPIIINYAVLTEGIAEPAISEALLMETLDREMRLYDGKDDCLVQDFLDNIKGGIVGMIHTLLGLDPKTRLSRAMVEKGMEDVHRSRESEAYPIIEIPDYETSFHTKGNSNKAEDLVVDQEDTAVAAPRFSGRVFNEVIVKEYQKIDSVDLSNNFTGEDMKSTTFGSEAQLSATQEPSVSMDQRQQKHDAAILPEDLFYKEQESITSASASASRSEVHQDLSAAMNEKQQDIDNACAPQKQNLF
ncbi:hypothetical protein BGZ54_001295 [Gamsiella multidivaricata]|nr:hypothetical protein BGZ54_001295 [Gamsiella multidivaricata]